MPHLYQTSHCIHVLAYTPVNLCNIITQSDQWRQRVSNLVGGHFLQALAEDPQEPGHQACLMHYISSAL